MCLQMVRTGTSIQNENIPCSGLVDTNLWDSKVLIIMSYGLDPVSPKGVGFTQMLNWLVDVIFSLFWIIDEIHDSWQNY